VVVSPSPDNAMLKPHLFRSIVLCSLWGSTAPLVAQVAPSPMFPQADPVKMAALAANSQRTMRPASFVLSHKTELALTAKQVAQLDLLVRVEDDSAAVRSFRLEALMARIMEKRQADNSTRQIGWDGPVDESRLRSEACEQAGIASEAMINLYRDRQAVGKILTGNQVNLAVELEMSDVIRILKP
jgi:hypothetical protein